MSDLIKLDSGLFRPIEASLEFIENPHSPKRLRMSTDWTRRTLAALFARRRFSEQGVRFARATRGEIRSKREPVPRLPKSCREIGRPVAGNNYRGVSAFALAAFFAPTHLMA